MTKPSNAHPDRSVDHQQAADALRHKSRDFFAGLLRVLTAVSAVTQGLDDVRRATSDKNPKPAVAPRSWRRQKYEDAVAQLEGEGTRPTDEAVGERIGRDARTLRAWRQRRDID